MRILDLAVLFEAHSVSRGSADPSASGLSSTLGVLRRPTFPDAPDP